MMLLSRLPVWIVHRTFQGTHVGEKMGIRMDWRGMVHAGPPVVRPTICGRIEGMARTVTVADDAVHIRLRGWHALFAISGRLRVPYAAIQRVDADAGAIPRPLLRVGGGSLPFSEMYGGRFWNRDGWMWFSFEHRSRTITLTLTPASTPPIRYRWVSVEVADPAATRDQIRRRIGERVL